MYDPDTGIYGSHGGISTTSSGLAIDDNKKLGLERVFQQQLNLGVIQIGKINYLY